MDPGWHKQLVDLLDWEVNVVSTIDHPYPSLPIHLFDGHLRLSRTFGDSVLIMNWDVSYPLDRFYRYDLITDCGFIGKHPKLYHYTLKKAYADQRFDPQPWTNMPRGIAVAGHALQQKYRLSDSFTGDLIQRALEFLNTVRTVYYDGIPPSQYTAEQLKLCYKKLQQFQLQRFIATQYRNYDSSAFTLKWIPLCLRDVKGPLAFSSLHNAGLFKREPFRARTPEIKEIITGGKLSEIASSIELGQVIPSLDVFYWSLAIAGVQHYGNDFEFFQRLADLSGIRELSFLQYTKDEEDCTRFVKFAADYAVLLEIDEDVRLSNRIAHQSKLSRITTFGAIMIAMGDSAIGLLDEYANGKYQRATLSLERTHCAVKLLNDE